MDLKLQVKQTQTLSQRMIQSAEILQMTSQELNTYINELALENPVIDIVEPPTAQEQRESIEQQEWLKNRDARAAESSGRNSGSMEGISYAAALVSLTRDRAYELAGRYEEANGVFYEDEDSSQTALP